MLFRSKGWIFGDLYRFYLRKVLPLVERFALRGAQDFAMLGVYVGHFGDCGFFARALRREGLIVEYKRYFFGCATGVVGHKP